MPSCSSCQAPIRWVVVASTGRRMPIDPDPAANGNIVFRPGGSEVEYVGAPRPDGGLVGDEYEGRRFVSHFATCPNASKHRKSRG